MEVAASLAAWGVVVDWAGEADTWGGLVATLEAMGIAVPAAKGGGSKGALEVALGAERGVAMAV